MEKRYVLQSKLLIINNEKWEKSDYVKIVNQVYSDCKLFYNIAGHIEIIAHLIIDNLYFLKQISI